MKTIADEIIEIEKGYMGDAQGFYAAQGQLYAKRGLANLLTDMHFEAMEIEAKAKHDAFMGNSNWREEKPF